MPTICAQEDPFPSPPILPLRGWWGVSSFPVFLSTASHVSWSGSMSSPARCAACEAAEEPPHCDKTRGSRQLVFFYSVAAMYLYVTGRQMSRCFITPPPPRPPLPHPCLGLSFCLTRITTTHGCGNKRLVDAMSEEGGRYEAVHRERRACVDK